jgi:polyisoprenoid-binding protein YceI
METLSSTLTKTIWAIDPAHSQVQFKVKHLVISTVTGTFKKFEALVQLEGDDWATAEVNFSADISRIDTGQEQRDGHLKSADFFDAENHPKLIFTSTGIEKISDDQFKLTGDLTIRGITKSIVLDVELGGQATDGYGNTKAGFELSGKIKRKEFGLHWNAVTETGNIVVADEVKIIANVQFSRQN